MHMHIKTYTPCEQGLGVHGNNQVSPQNNHVFVRKVKEMPGKNAEMFGSSRVVHKNESGKGSP